MKITTALRRKLESYVASAKSKGTALGWKKHLRSWPAYAAAGASSLAIVSSAGAGIISSGPLNLVVKASTGHHGYYRSRGISFNSNIPRLGGFFAKTYLIPNVATFHERSVANTGCVSLLISNNAGRAYFFDDPGVLSVKRFNSGDVISNGAGTAAYNVGNIAFRANYAKYPSFKPSYGWPINVPGFAGVQFTQPDGIHFGWLKMKWGANSDGLPDSLAILGWAYNDVAGAPIRAGEVPEPGAMTIAILGAGCAGVLALRRRRRERTNAEAAS